MAHSLHCFFRFPTTHACASHTVVPHSNADTLKRLNEAEKLLKEAREAAYIDQGASDKEKDEGNAAFKEARYPEAVKHYTEALKRGPPKVNAEAYKLFRCGLRWVATGCDG